MSMKNMTLQGQEAWQLKRFGRLAHLVTKCDAYMPNFCDGEWP